MSKKLWSVLALVTIVAMVAVACGPKPTEAPAPPTEAPTKAPAPTEAPEVKFKVGMVSDVGGIDDASFNENTWKGLQDAQEQLGVEATFLESQAQADYENNITEFAEQGYDMIITVGFLLGDATYKMAAQYPDIKFAIVDYASGGEETPNVQGILFNVNEASFPVGYVAAAMADQLDPDDPVVAYVGGMQIPPVEEFIVAYEHGVKYYNEKYGKDVKFTGVYVGDFESPDLGKLQANSLIDEGADIIMGVGGKTGNGGIAAAKERGKWGVGVDVDQYYTLPNEKDVLVTSTIKRLDKAVFGVIKAALEGQFAGGTNYIATLENEGVGVGPFHDFEDKVPEEIKADLEQIQKDIIAKKLWTGWGEKPEAAEAPAPTGEVKTVVLGFTASQTGAQNVSSVRQVNGLNLWLNEVNAAGGIVLSDGTAVQFEAVSYDDESNKDRVQELYTRLTTEDNADFLISPYSSGLTDASAVIAEQYGKVMITTGAASDATYQKGYTLVFQAYTPASRYLTGAVDLLAKLDPSVKKVAFVYENDKFSTDVVNAAKGYAESKGYEIVLFEGYDSETTDFGPFINKIEAAAPEALMGGGHFQDGSTFARQIYDKQVSINYFALLVAPPEPDFADLGDAALGVVGPSQWEPLAQFTPESAAEAGLEWFGALGDDFVSAYKAAYNEEPSYHSMGGYAAGQILQKAIVDADSTDPEAIKKAMEAMDILTGYGRIKFDTSEEAHGLQIGHSMVYVQWQKDDAGNLVKQVVWPPEGKTADPLYPKP